MPSDTALLVALQAGGAALVAADANDPLPAARAAIHACMYDDSNPFSCQDVKVALLVAQSAVDGLEVFGRQPLPEELILGRQALQVCEALHRLRRRVAVRALVVNRLRASVREAVSLLGKPALDATAADASSACAARLRLALLTATRQLSKTSPALIDSATGKLLHLLVRLSPARAAALMARARAAAATDA